MVYDISMGVRKDRPELRTAVDRQLARDETRIQSILSSYGVPRADDGP
jgi:hypothetical protein